MTDEELYYAEAERRIEYLTIGIGASSAVAALLIWGARAGLGVAVGALLSWLNFRWLKEGVGTLARLSAGQVGAERVRVPRIAYVKLLGRYALLVAGAYVILRGFRSTALSLFAGLFAAVAAVMVELIGQLFRGGGVPHAGS